MRLYAHMTDIKTVIIISVGFPQWVGQRVQHVLLATAPRTCAPGTYHRVHYPSAERHHVPAVRPRIRIIPGVLRVPGHHEPAGTVSVHRRATLPVDVQPGRLYNRGDRWRGPE